MSRFWMGNSFREATFQVLQKSPDEREDRMRQIETEIVRASEMREKVLQRIWDIRTGAARAQALEEYERQLAQYEKQKGKRQEVTITMPDKEFVTHRRSKAVGF